MCASSCYGKSEIDKSLMHRDLPTVGIVSIMGKCQPHWIQIGESGISMYMMWYVVQTFAFQPPHPTRWGCFTPSFSWNLETWNPNKRPSPHPHLLIFSLAIPATYFASADGDGAAATSVAGAGSAGGAGTGTGAGAGATSGAGAGGAGTSTRPWPSKRL